MSKIKANFYPVGERSEITKNSIEILSSCGYLENKKGYYDRKTGKSRQARMRGASKLIDMIAKACVDPIHQRMIEREVEKPILLRDEWKQEIDFSYNRKLKDMRANVNKINSYLALQNIEFLPSFSTKKEMGEDQVYMPNLRRNNLVRIFNETFDRGGRFYRHWAQSLPSKYRKYININGQNVTEIDYCSIHPYILYAWEGLPLPEGDVYSLDGEDLDCPDNRKICKKILLVIFNVNSTEDPAQVVISELNKERFPGVNKHFIETLISKLKEKHTPISDYSASGVGLQLQRYDSDLAEKIMLRLKDKDIPCLPIHDSFIVPEKNEQELRYAMVEEAEALIGQTPRIEKKY